MRPTPKMVAIWYFKIEIVRIVKVYLHRLSLMYYPLHTPMLGRKGEVKEYKSTQEIKKQERKANSVYTEHKCRCVKR